MKFTEALREFGLKEVDISTIESRVKEKKGITGTYLLDGQEFGFSSDDGIDPVILRKLAAGFEPSSGKYSVGPAKPDGKTVCSERVRPLQMPRRLAG